MMQSETPLPNPVSPPPRSFLTLWWETRKRLKALRDWSPVTGELEGHEVGKPFVSIMVITYNHERYIRQALDSILMQERDFPIEINVIDDASTDSTQAIVREYAQRFPEIVNCYFNQSNAGHIATQLNTIRGFQTLRGRYFALLEGDDYWTDPRKLTKQVGFLEKHEGYVACAHPVWKIFDDGNRAPEHFLPDQSQFGRVADIGNLIRMESVYHLSSIVYRNVFGHRPPACLSDKYSHEATINMLYGVYGKFFCMHEYMSEYRVHSAGTFSVRSDDNIWRLHLHGIRRMAFYLGGHSAFIFARSIRKLTSYVLKTGKKIAYVSVKTRILMRLHNVASRLFCFFGRTGLFKYKKIDSLGEVAFKKALLKEMCSSSPNFHEGNWDVAAQGREPYASPPSRYKAFIRWFFPSLRYRRRLRKTRGIGYLYDRLVDFQSRDLLVKLLTLRIMGHRRVKLPQNNSSYWSNIKKIENLEVVGPPVGVNFMRLTLQLRNFQPLGYDVRAYCSASSGSRIFLQKQYVLQRRGAFCEVQKGDTVIDAGAGWGETSLFFASQVGEKGRVISYEFVPSNIAVFDKNLASNPHLAARITAIHNPLCESSGKIVHYVDWGLGSQVGFEESNKSFNTAQCRTITIDATVARLSLNRVDFIKMNNKGLELNALKGAEKTLRYFHPKLAISLHHSLDDFKSIPRYLDGLGLQYSFYLDHHTIYESETVLFAVPIK